MINILCKFPPDWLQEVRGAVLQGSGGVMVEDESNTGYFHLREIVAKGSRSDTKAREDAILRDPNLNTLYHSIGQEALPSLGVENLRPRGIWFPLSCDKVPDDKPRASKQWKRRGEPAVPVLFNISTLPGTESGQQRKGSLQTSCDGVTGWSLFSLRKAGTVCSLYH